MNKQNYWKKKYFKLKRSHDLINIFNIKMEEFTDVDTSMYKIDLESTNNQVAHHLTLIEKLDRLNKSNKGNLGRLFKKVRDIYFKSKYVLKYPKYKVYFSRVRYILIAYSSVTIINSIYSKITSGEFSWDLIIDLLHILISTI